MPSEKTLSRGACLLRQWRGQLAQIDACKLLDDIDPATYSKFESGARRPGGEWAARIEEITRGFVPAASWYQPSSREARAS